MIIIKAVKNWDRINGFIYMYTIDNNGNKDSHMGNYDDDDAFCDSVKSLHNPDKVIRISEATGSEFILFDRYKK